MNPVLTEIVEKKSNLTDAALSEKLRVRFSQMLGEIEKALPKLTSDERISLAVNRIMESEVLEIRMVRLGTRLPDAILKKSWLESHHLVECLDKYSYKIYLNINCLKENYADYAGNYVALKDDKVVASGKTIVEAYEDAKTKSVNVRYLHYIVCED